MSWLEIGNNKYFENLSWKERIFFFSTQLKTRTWQGLKSCLAISLSHCWKRNALLQSSSNSVTEKEVSSQCRQDKKERVKITFHSSSNILLMSFFEFCAFQRVMGITCLLQICSWNSGNKIPYLARIVLIQSESEAS